LQALEDGLDLAELRIFFLGTSHVRPLGAAVRQKCFTQNLVGKVARCTDGAALTSRPASFARCVTTCPHFRPTHPYCLLACLTPTSGCVGYQPSQQFEHQCINRGVTSLMYMSRCSPPVWGTKSDCRCGRRADGAQWPRFGWPTTCILIGLGTIRS
jgi:hypothetical protein